VHAPIIDEAWTPTVVPIVGPARKLAAVDVTTERVERSATATPGHSRQCGEIASANLVHHERQVRTNARDLVGAVRRPAEHRCPARVADDSIDRVAGASLALPRRHRDQQQTTDGDQR
jgi:hypothetical protein